MKALTILIAEEVREHVRNRWIVSAVALFAALALTLAFLGSLPVGQTRVAALTVTTVSLASLSVYLVPLIALGLSFDSMVGERERGTLQLLMTYPIERWQPLLGKYTGQMMVLGLAIVLGYGAAGVLLAVRAEGQLAGWRDYHLMMGSSVLLGGAFAALGCLVSVLVRQRATAIVAVIGLWLMLVLLYDLGLLVVLVADKNQALSAGFFSFLMTINPADAYRVLNLMGSEGASMITGMAGTVNVHPAMLLCSLGLWTLLPLALAVTVLQRREL